MSENLFRDDDLILDIRVLNGDNRPVHLFDDSSRYISESLTNYPPTDRQVDEAIRTLISSYRYYGTAHERINISYMERKLTPIKEVTIREIEEQLGYRVKIVKEK